MATACTDGQSVVAAIKPSFKRFNNSLRRVGSARYSRTLRPQSVLLAQDAQRVPPPPDVISHVLRVCDERINCTEHPDDPAAWSTSFEKLLECPWGLQTFADFLKKEFSAENIYFWTACERFKRLSPGLERTAEAQRIYQQHLCVGAPEAVNVDSKARQFTEQALQDGSATLFNQAQKQIFNLMKFDSYTRFLKSALYNQCLNGNVQKYDLETGLLTYPLSMMTSGKLKKSLSNAEDRRRKSLLPWHRKNRSKSKDRGELEYNNNTNSSGNYGSGHDNGSQGNETSHSVSSLTSIDLALHSGIHESNLASMASINSMTSASLATSGDDTASVTSSTNSARTALCRVILSNGSTTVVQIQPSETIEQLIGRLLHKRGIQYKYYVVHSDKHDKPIDISEPSQTIAGCEVSVEWRVTFKLYLPNEKIIGVKSKCNKKLVEILRPILLRYSFNIDQVFVLYNNQWLDVNTPITVLDGARIIVQLKEGDSQGTLKKSQTNALKQTTLEEITNRVYEDILLEKSDIVANSKSERGSVKSEDWGSEHSSSGIFGRFLRRDSAIHERKKKQGSSSYKARCNGQLQAQNQQLQTKHLLGSSSQSSAEDVTVSAANGNHGSVAMSNNQVMKKPLIAKWRSGVKLQIACASESEELYEGVSRAQRSRLEDQRGTEINYELPEFLKSKEQINNLRKIQQNQGQLLRSPKTKIDTGASLDSSLSRIMKTSANYENRSILVSGINHHSPDKFVNSEVAKYENKKSPSKFVDKTSPFKLKSMDPPPLPPKPKILPMRPSNWGGINNANSPPFKVPTNLTVVTLRGTDCANGVVQSNPQTSPLFLEQPASSFV